MVLQNDINFNRIAEAIGYIYEQFKEQPNLDDIAQKVHLSPYHFQRMFTEWAGVSPKKFLQYVSTGHAKKLLREQQVSLSEASYQTGLSGSSRLHDLFINIEGMTPAEYKNGGENLSINYSFFSTPFGEVIVASTTRGICYLAFHDDQVEALVTLKAMYPNARFMNASDSLHQAALAVISHDKVHPHEVKLHLKGSDFQLKVWEALLQIPSGQLISYGQVAHYINRPKAFRAVGTAVGDNPVAYIIPCHRVIQSSGALGQYHWGSNRKVAIVGWESAKSYETTYSA